MPTVTHKVIAALLSLLLLMGGQGVFGAQDMPMGKTSSMAVDGMSDCGHFGGVKSTVNGGAGDTDRQSGSLGCGSADDMACLGSMSHCAMTLILAPGPALGFSASGSHSLGSGPVSAYRNPFLGVVTPPPQLRS